MDPDTYSKYLKLRENRDIYKLIWYEKNNNKRNCLIHNIYITLLKSYKINNYFKDNIVSGMPIKHNIVTIDLFFNQYNLSFDIDIYHNNTEYSSTFSSKYINVNNYSIDNLYYTPKMSIFSLSLLIKNKLSIENTTYFTNRLLDLKYRLDNYYNYYYSNFNYGIYLILKEIGIDDIKSTLIDYLIHK